MHFLPLGASPSVEGLRPRVLSLVPWWLTNSSLYLETELGTSSLKVRDSLELGQAIFRTTTDYRLEAEGEVKKVNAKGLDKGYDILKLFWPLSREHGLDEK